MMFSKGEAKNVPHLACRGSGGMEKCFSQESKCCDGEKKEE